MPMNMSHHFSKQQRRGLIFGVGSLLAVSWMASSLISQRTHLKMDDPVNLEGWRISFKTPIGWTEGKFEMASGDLEEYVFIPISDQYGTANSLIRVRRKLADSSAIPREFCTEIVEGFSTSDGVKPLRNHTEYAESMMGDWPACHASVRQTWDVHTNRLGMHAEILTAIDHQPDATHGYSIELQTFGYMGGRELAIWKSIVESIRIVGG
ncbi:MAG: hypothetical protein DHS20C16_07520 [Phycisphaerae bacterium]|nr:MAG: hypothetical protein DHS20C16_07520 [Phycisphaerae bacterium]